MDRRRRIPERARTARVWLRARRGADRASQRRYLRIAAQRTPLAVALHPRAKKEPLTKPLAGHTLWRGIGTLQSRAPNWAADRRPARSRPWQSRRVGGPDRPLRPPLLRRRVAAGPRADRRLAVARARSTVLARDLGVREARASGPLDLLRASPGYVRLQLRDLHPRPPSWRQPRRQSRSQPLLLAVDGPAHAGGGNR